MALPPTIPTSFVPHEMVQHRHLETNFLTAFASLAYFIFGVVCLASAGVFFYDRVLDGRLSDRAITLAAAGKSVDPNTLADFVHLRNRLNASKTILGSHIAFSNFFTSLVALLPENVRFTSLSISVDPSGKASIQGSGIAKTFNTLAFTSAQFATEGRIKDVIFSKISVNKDKTVSFGISANLDPSIITYAPESYAATVAPTTSTSTSEIGIPATTSAAVVTPGKPAAKPNTL